MQFVTTHVLLYFERRNDAGSMSLLISYVINVKDYHTIYDYLHLISLYIYPSHTSISRDDLNPMIKLS